jgi:uncharacterized protein YpmB
MAFLISRFRGIAILIVVIFLSIFSSFCTHSKPYNYLEYSYL